MQSMSHRLTIVRPASALRRLLGVVVDLVLVVGLVTLATWAWASTQAEVIQTAPLSVFMYGGPVALGYYFVFEALFSRTPGKVVVGTHVDGPDGYPISWPRAAIRTVVRLAGPADFAVVLSGRPLALHDLVSGTRVVQRIRVPRGAVM